MSLQLAPVPPEPLPWENNEYEDNVDIESEDETMSERSYSTREGYESEDSVKTSWTFNIKARKSKKTEPVPYYNSILQEEEYFSE